MFVANIAPVLIVLGALGQLGTDVADNAIRSAIFFAGIGTIIQLFPIWKIGSRLPIVVGLSFTFVGVLSLVGIQYGLATMFIAIIVGGGLIAIAGLFAKYWRHFIKPIVSALVVLGIGLSLLSVGAKEFVGYDSVCAITASEIYDFSIGWPYIVVALSSLLSCLLFQIFVPGIWRNINILVGLVTGYLVALCFPGMVDFSAFRFQEITDFIAVPKPIFALIPFSASDFNIGAIVVVFLIYLVASTEGIGDLSSLANAGLGRDPTDQEIAGGLAADGVISSVCGCFGGLPLTTFSQNVGIVGQTKVVNRFTIFQGAVLLLLASFFPVLSRFLMTIPEPVLGGCMVMLFASIVAIGMQMLSKCGWSKKNIAIISLALGIGYGVTLISGLMVTRDNAGWANYLLLIFSNPVANMFLLALLLSYVIPDSFGEDKPKQKEN